LASRRGMSSIGAISLFAPYFLESRISPLDNHRWVYADRSKERSRDLSTHTVHGGQGAEFQVPRPILESYWVVSGISLLQLVMNPATLTAEGVFTVGEKLT
jgi:hypothetical protein